MYFWRDILFLKNLNLQTKNVLYRKVNNRFQNGKNTFILSVYTARKRGFL